MKNIELLRAEKFDSFLTKVIILSSKIYYKEQMAKYFNELKIIDDENYEEFINNYMVDNTDNSNIKTIANFIDVCENPILAKALKSLSDIEMAVIFLLFEKQFTNKQASKILEICDDSVSRIKKRAFKKIQKYFRDGE